MAIWNVIITRTFFQTQIPQELRESAEMDGCDDFGFVGRVVLPLSGAIIAVNALFYAVGHWNAFFGAFLYLSDKTLFPLQIVLREVLLMGQTDDMEAMVMDAEQAEDARFLSELLRYSLIVVSSLPVVLMYPFVQKYFVKGIMIGAIKG
jgi:multiple sugar transport system permease protein/putative aldouronate transport system permease protein